MSAPVSSSAAACRNPLFPPISARLHRAGLVTTKRLGQWIFYKRNEETIAEFLAHAAEGTLTCRSPSSFWRLSSFAIGTTEFVIMGLLPEISADLSVTIPQAGWLVTGYALAVAIGAPIMAVSTAHLRRRSTLIMLMGFFILGNLLCAIAPGYWVLMIARIVTALCHGAFFGIGSVVAASLVAEDRKARAVALMFTGLTLANVLGVPLGTAIGHAFGWRAPFWIVTLLGVASLTGLMLVLPKGEEVRQDSLAREISALRGLGLWLSLLTTVFFAAAMFTLFTYIAPLLRDVTGVSQRRVTWTLLSMGIGLTIGNLIGGKLADWRLGTTLAGIFAAIALTSAIFSYHQPFLHPSRDHPLPLGGGKLRRRAGATDQRRWLRQGCAEPGVDHQHRRLQYRQCTRRLGRRHRHRRRLLALARAARRCCHGAPRPCNRRVDLRDRQSEARRAHLVSFSFNSSPRTTRKDPSMTKLFEPTKLGDISLTNRIVMAPLTRNRSPNAVPNDLNVKYYAQRATAGLIITEATAITHQGQGYADVPGLYTKEALDGWKKVTDAVHANGGKIVVQMWHVGRISHTTLQPNGGKPVSSTSRRRQRRRPIWSAATAPAALPRSPSHALSRPRKSPASSRITARPPAPRSKPASTASKSMAPMAICIDQFLRADINDRTDQYGGSIENRARFLFEVVDAVTKEVGAGRTAIRISPVTPSGDASDPHPQAIFTYVVEGLAKYGLAYIHVVEGQTGGARDFLPFDYEALHAAYKAAAASRPGWSTTAMIARWRSKPSKAARPMSSPSASLSSPIRISFAA